MKSNHLKSILKIKKNNINNIEIYKFQDNNYNFPNLNDSHVTYKFTRVFIANYLPKDIDFLMYRCRYSMFTESEQEINKVVKSKVKRISPCRSYRRKA